MIFGCLRKGAHRHERETRCGKHSTSALFHDRGRYRKLVFWRASGILTQFTPYLDCEQSTCAQSPWQIYSCRSKCIKVRLLAGLSGGCMRSATPVQETFAKCSECASD